MNDLDLPFEEGPRMPMVDIGDATLAAGVVVMAATLDLPVGRMPALVFRFAKPDDTGFYPPIMLVGDDDDLAKLPPLINAAVASARRAAS